MRKASTVVGFISIIVIVIAFVIFCVEYWVLNIDFELRSRIKRIQIVILIQTSLCFGDVFVWKNIAHIFSDRNYLGCENESESRTRSNRTTSVGLRLNRNEKFWKLAVILYLILTHSSYMCNIFLVRTEPALFALVAYFTLAFHVQLITALILFAAFRFITKSFTSRKFMSQKHVVLTCMVYAFLLTSVGYLRAQRPPIIKHVEIPIKDLPDSLQGFSIVHISDIHLGPTVGRRKFERVVNMVNDLSPDLVVVVGDLVDGYVTDLKEAIEVIKYIRSKNGVYFVTGNHEYYTADANNWIKHLESLGVNVLHNSHDKIPKSAPRDGQFCLVGTDDLQADKFKYDNHGFKLDDAVAGCDDNQPVMLLAHQPAAAKKALESSHKIDLVLSGHTHGGQMFPFVIFAYFGNPYFAGLYSYGPHSHVYVSKGTVYWGMPIRLLSTQEIAKITLTRL